MDDRKRHGWAFWTTVVVLLLALYVASSGPVLATAFRLREATHNDGWYAVMWGYYPLLVLDRACPIGLEKYIEWWCKLFNTVGPG